MASSTLVGARQPLFKIAWRGEIRPAIDSRAQQRRDISEFQMLLVAEFRNKGRSRLILDRWILMAPTARLDLRQIVVLRARRARH
jgi:hypothetical protein